MTASQLPLALAQRHHNRQLFADRYVDETRPRRSAWLDLLGDAAPALVLRAELLKVFKQDIPLKDRDDWEEWLGVQREKHRQHTAAIIADEIDLNQRVYQLFDLSTEEITLIEASTKYQYGEV